MPSLPALLSLAHVLGLVLGAGAATAKLTLLRRCRADPALVPGYIAGAPHLTRLILVGLVLLLLSGVGWLISGYPFTPLLVVKLTLVAGIWVLGPVIDKVAEPRFRELAPGLNQPASPAFLQAQGRYFLLELAATGLFYAIIVMWTLW